MENNGKTKESINQHPNPTDDFQLEIETVTPDTEDLQPHRQKDESNVKLDKLDKTAPGTGRS